uniref:DMT family transporter n=1 Tax=Roseovarius indicus TaxID=540747 RepID=UPI003B52CE29
MTSDALSRRLSLIGALVVIGAGWGLTTPLSKIAVSEGYRHFGLIFWQLVITGTMLTVVTRLRGRRVPVTWADFRVYLLIAVIGTILPNSASYAAAVELPGGVLAILLSTVPLFAFPVAIALGNDSFGWTRALGLLFGLGCVLLIVGPDASLPDPAMAAFIPLALVAPFFYGLEGNVVARFGANGLDPVQMLAGASITGIPIALMLALATGQWIDPRGPLGAPDAAVMASAIVHGIVYTSYFWLVAQAGPVFAAQVSYLVTGFGVAWSMALLGESYSPYIWTALALMLVGVFLVQPRPRIALAPIAPIGKNGPQQERDSQT